MQREGGLRSAPEKSLLGGNPRPRGGREGDDSLSQPCPVTGEVSSQEPGESLVFLMFCKSAWCHHQKAERDSAFSPGGGKFPLAFGCFHVCQLD